MLINDNIYILIHGIVSRGGYGGGARGALAPPHDYDFLGICGHYLFNWIHLIYIYTNYSVYNIYYPNGPLQWDPMGCSILAINIFIINK